MDKNPTERPLEPQSRAEKIVEFKRQKTLLKTGALQDAIFNSAYFSSIATDEKGVIQIFNVGAERMLGYAADDVLNRITSTDYSTDQASGKIPPSSSRTAPNSTPSPTSPTSKRYLWSLSFYSQFFDVDTTDVVIQNGPYRSGFPSSTSRKFWRGKREAQERRRTSVVSTSKNWE